ncbi:hypothetical protein [Hydrogenivirga sp.]
MKKFLATGIILCVLSLLVSCGGGGGGGTKTPSNPGGLSPLTASEFSSLKPEDQYRVVSKLTDTLMKGVPPGEFFDLQRTSFDLTLKESNYLDKIRKELSTSIPHDKKDYYFKLTEDNYYYDDSIKPPQYIMALLWEFPLSKDYYDMWMAYFLANTKLFSPGAELESVSHLDIEKVFSRLYRMIAADKSVREIVYEHMISQENWRRFRSPEDNTREMMEIFLRRFKDEEVPKAALACKNWSLTGQDQGYQLVIDIDENTEPQSILDTSVTTCWDFYRAISEHSSLMPTVVAEIVDHLFSSYSDSEKDRVVKRVLAKNPRTFRDIFNTILFSKEYLLKNERPKKWEEAFYGTAHRLSYRPSPYFFRFINRKSGYSSFVRLYDMKQPPLVEKLGRTPVPPLDALSFAYYHKSVREHLMINRVSYDGDDGWRDTFYDVSFGGDDFINYVFIAALGRKATQEELDTFNDIFTTKNWTDRHKWQKATIILDYISRLPEFYMFTKVQ